MKRYIDKILKFEFLAFNSELRKFMVSKKIDNFWSELFKFNLAEIRLLAVDQSNFLNEELFLSWIQSRVFKIQSLTL
jgi:hypothetical protein